MFKSLQCRRCGFARSLVRKIPWNRKWQPAPVFLPGKSHGQRSLSCHSPWGLKVYNSLYLLIQIFKNFTYLFIHFWLPWVSRASSGLSLAAASGAPLWLRCVVVMWRMESSWSSDQTHVALHWKANSSSLDHQGSPRSRIFWMW